MAVNVEALVLLLILHPPLASGGIQEVKEVLAPKDDSCLGWMSEKFWGTIKWYFTNARLIIVLGIDGGGGEIDSATTFFVNFLHSVPMPAIVVRYDQSQGLEKLPFSRRIGVIVVAHKLENFEIFFRNTPADSVESTNSNFLFVLLEQAPPIAAEKFFLDLWAQHSILTLLLAMPCSKQNSQEDMSQMLGYLDPFVQREASWGAMKWIHVEDLDIQPSESYSLWHGDGNFRGFPIKIGIFLNVPTVLEKKEIPDVFARSYILTNSKSRYGGLDAIVLATLADKLNFTIKLKMNKRMDFGFKMDNGTFTGTLGDVLNKATDISFNNRFVLFYHTNDIDFLYPITSDQFCLLAPKALVKPKWLAVFQCFSLDVWLMILFSNFICGLVRYSMKRYQRLIDPNPERKHTLSRIMYETWNVMMTAPIIRLPRRFTERLFLGVCLLINVIIIGTFQGTLFTSISTPISYKDINTLQELDDSGLIIRTGSEQLYEIFGDGGTPVLDSLNRKLAMVDRAKFDKVISNGETVFIARKADSKLNIEMEFLKPDGTPAFHVIPECPRNYHMAYTVRKGWFFSSLMNKVLSRLREAGFIDMWYKSTEDAILLHKRIHFNKPPNELKAFNLEDMQTSFFVLGLGLIICGLVLLVEITWKRSP